MSVGEGHLKNYLFSQKNNWRHSVWKDIAKRTAPTKSRRILFMPGSSCNDVYNALYSGFKLKNMVAIERDRDAAKSIRKKFGILTIRCDISDICDATEPVTDRIGKFDVVFFDFCGGLTETNRASVLAAPLMLKSDGIIVANFLRGRDGVKTKKVDGIAAKLITLMGAPGMIDVLENKNRAVMAHYELISVWRAKAQFSAPKFRTYSSGSLKYDSLTIRVKLNSNHGMKGWSVSTIENQRLALLLDECEARAKYFQSVIGTRPEAQEEFSKVSAMVSKIKSKLKSKEQSLLLRIGAAVAVRSKQLGYDNAN